MLTPFIYRSPAARRMPAGRGKVLGIVRQPSRLTLALLVSVLLHGAVLGGRWPQPTPKPPQRLDVRLIVPEEKVEQPPPPEEPIFKNTLTQNTEPPKQETAPTPQPLAAATQGKPARLHKRQEQEALRKLSERVFYPEAAVRAGLEGTVHLLIRLDADGSVREVSVAASSGHAVLDDAAMRAARGMGRLSASTRREFILPVTFTLQ